MTNLNRVRAVLDRCADQRFLYGPPIAVGCARPNIPSRWRNDLVVGDLAITHVNPVAQCAADGLGCAPALTVFFSWLYIPFVVQFELAQIAFGFAIENAKLVHPRKVAQHRRSTAHLAVHIQHQPVAVLEVMARNSAIGRKAVVKLAESLNGTERTPSPDGIDTCLDYALITAEAARNPETIHKLQVIAGRALSG